MEEVVRNHHVELLTLALEVVVAGLLFVQACRHLHLGSTGEDVRLLAVEVIRNRHVELQVLVFEVVVPDLLSVQDCRDFDLGSPEVVLNRHTGLLVLALGVVRLGSTGEDVRLLAVEVIRNRHVEPQVLVLEVAVLDLLSVQDCRGLDLGSTEVVLNRRIGLLVLVLGVAFPDLLSVQACRNLDLGSTGDVVLHQTGMGRACPLRSGPTYFFLEHCHGVGSHRLSEHISGPHVGNPYFSLEALAVHIQLEVEVVPESAGRAQTCWSRR